MTDPQQLRILSATVWADSPLAETLESCVAHQISLRILLRGLNKEEKRKGVKSKGPEFNSAQDKLRPKEQNIKKREWKKKEKREKEKKGE